MEIFSSKNEILDDKEIIKTSLKILKSSKYKNSRISLGNILLFELLINLLLHAINIMGSWYKW